MSFSGFQQALARSVNDLSGTQKSLGLGGIIPVPNVTLTYTSISSNVSQDQTATISGASLGDIVIVAPTTALVAGLTMTSFVSAADTVTVRLHNATGGGITPGALVFNIIVLKP